MEIKQIKLIGDIDVFGENKILNQHYGLTILKFKNILVQSEDFNRIGNKNF